MVPVSVIAGQWGCLASFDELVGTAEQRWRYGEAKGFGGLEVDNHLEFRDLLDRQIRGFVAPDDAPGINARLPVRLQKVAAASPPAALKSRDC